MNLAVISANQAMSKSYFLLLDFLQIQSKNSHVTN